MYVPKHFEERDPDILSALMRQFNFALLVTARNGLPVGTHVPLHVDDGGKNGRLLGHLARANDHWQDFDGEREAMAVFQGPHSYISPNWYVSEGQVPTWNYAAVHAYGTPEIIDDPQAAYIDQEKLVEFNEAGCDMPWRLGDHDREFIDGMIRAIVNFRIPITRIEGKFKLSQNRPVEDRERVAVRLQASTDHATAACGLLMAAWR